MTDIQVVAIIAAIIREVSGGTAIPEAVALAREYLAESRRTEGRGP